MLGVLHDVLYMDRVFCRPHIITVEASIFIRICCGGVEWVNALGRMLYVRYGVQLAACCVGSGQSPWLIPCVMRAVSPPPRSHHNTFHACGSLSWQCAADVSTSAHVSCTYSHGWAVRIFGYIC